MRPPRHLRNETRRSEASPGPDDGSPPIPPAIRTSRTTRSLADGPSSAGHPVVHGGSPARRDGDPAPVGRSLRRPRGDLGDDQEDPVERGVEPERRPDRLAPDEQPAEGQGDRHPAGERRRRPARRHRPRWSPRSSGRGRRRRPAPPSTTPRVTPSPRTQAVVANARKRISSPNGATTTPARSDRAKPTFVAGRWQRADRLDRDGPQQDRRRRSRSRRRSAAPRPRPPARRPRPVGPAG